MADRIGQSVVAKLLELGFTQEEIEYQFTGEWDAQPDRELGKASEKTNNGQGQGRDRNG